MALSGPQAERAAPAIRGFPLSPEQLRFIESSVSSDLLRDLIGDYLATPAGVTSREKQAKDRAAGRLANYIANILWDGDPATRPELVLKGQATLPRGHHTMPSWRHI